MVNVGPQLQWPKEFRGSRLRCLVLSSLGVDQIARSLSELAWPHALVQPRAFWRPRGFLDAKEPEWCKTDEFLSPEICKAVLNWWLAVPKNARTPVWDLAATCTVLGYEQRGVLLVEAKAHSKELSAAGKRRAADTNKENHHHIGDAIGQANVGLNCALPGWNLQRDSHYQLSNRFAWAWKIAQLGVPVVLIYLGFLNSEEMADEGTPFHDALQWKECLLAHAVGIVPEQAWECRLLIDGTPLIPMIRTLDLKFSLT